MLDQPVPVYITYMTAVPDGQSIAYYDDAYGRDKARVADNERRHARAWARAGAARASRSRHIAAGRGSAGPGRPMPA